MHGGISQSVSPIHLKNYKYMLQLKINFVELSKLYTEIEPTMNIGKLFDYYNVMHTESQKVAYFI
jgi:hypothetical protein